VKRLHLLNTSVLGIAHLLAIVAIVHIVTDFSWLTLGLAFLWLWLSGMAITAGYHRLYAHRSYRSAAPVRAFFLIFGAVAVQNSALRWAADHRVHHANTDTERDPYSIKRGFWWAHVGWVLTKRKEVSGAPADLLKDPLIRWQHKYYVPIAGVFGALLPAAIGSLWGDAWGCFLVVGFLRLVIQWHCTFSINSLAHFIGSRPYNATITARDSFITALVSFGEGYHNFHHAFQADYRNGVRWFDFDPAKWLIFGLSRVRLAWDLRRTPGAAIARAREANA